MYIVYLHYSKMIQSIKHKGLKLYWTKGDRSKLPSTMVRTIETVMSIVDNLEVVPDDLYPFPKLKPHPLKGDRQGEWAVSISGNWRITFRFDNSTGMAYDLSLEDYH